MLQRDGAFCDVRGIIAYPLEVAGDLERGEDLAQVAGHRLTQRQETDGQRADLGFELVDAGVGFDDVGSELAVAFHHRLGRGGDLRFRQATHLGDRAGEALQFVVVAFDDVFRRHCCFSLPLPQISRSGR